MPSAIPAPGDATIARAIAAVLRQAQEGELPLYAWTLALSPEEFAEMVASCFPEFAMGDGSPQGIFAHLAASAPPAFRQLAVLLLYNRSPGADLREVKWLAGAIAAACFGSRALWRDLGLPGGEALDRLMEGYFRPLHRRHRCRSDWKCFLRQEFGALTGRGGGMSTGCACRHPPSECWPERRWRWT